ncbi:MAG: hypothetical protein ACOC2W_00120 [bacterium]
MIANNKTEEIINEISINGLEHKTPYKKNNKTTNMTLGRQFFNSLLPDDYETINKPINKKTLDIIIQDILEKYGHEKTNEVVSNIQRYGFMLSSITPSSFNVDGLIPPKEWIKKKEEFLNNPPKDMEKYNKKVRELTKELVDYVEESGMKIHNVLVGGIKGNPISDWGAILVSKGYVLDIENNLLGPIKHGINDGYDPIEFYQGASEARRGFYYKSTAVQDPGYLARKLSMANAKTSIDESIKDCGTKKYLLFNITKKNHNLVKNRYILKSAKPELIKDTEELIGETIKLRSPIYCKSEKGICPICYGDNYKNLKSKYVGILASGAVNSLAVNAFMKMRHQSSQVEIVDVNFNKLLQDTKIDPFLINKVLKVEKNKISAKEELNINIDKNDYDEKSLVDSGDFYMLPGLIDIIYGDEPETDIINLPFSFKIKLIKPENLIIDGKMLYLTYYPGEVIIEQENYLKEVDPTIITKLFEAQAKYITDPEILVYALHQQLHLDLVHLETIVQNMFRSSDDPTVLGRLVDYKNVEIYSQKKLPFVNSWLNSMAFENINKAISTGLLNDKSIQFDPYENIIMEKFNKEGN